MANVLVLAERLDDGLATPCPPPAFASGLVSRRRLVERLLDPMGPSLALLTAPAGYGKTTLLAEWSACDPRGVSWIALDRTHDQDPSLLACEIAAAVDRPGPFALVLDDVQVLQSVSARNILRALVDKVPPGSRVTLSSRTAPPLPIGRLRAQRSLLELGPRDLALTIPEAAALLKAEGVHPPGDATEHLVRATDGWPAALYLAALSLRGRGRPRCAERISVDDSALRQYLADSVLSELGPDAALLTRTSILDMVSGDICDSLLGCTGSGRLLDELATHNALLVPLDRAGEWYRCPEVLRQVLARELERGDPALAGELRQRATEWYAAHGDTERAIDQAIASGDADRAGELLWAHAPGYIAKGRRATVRTWLAAFAEDQVIADPRLALVSAWSAFADGDLDAVQRWQASALSRLVAAPRPADSGEAAAAAAMGAAASCAGLASIAGEAQSAREQMAEDSPWRSVTCFMEGAALNLAGDAERAERLLEDGARRGAVIAPGPHTLCLAQLALMAGDRGDWEGSAAIAARARGQVEHYGLGDYPTSALVFAASAAARARCGRIEESRADARQALHLLDGLSAFAPWFVAQVRVALASAALRLSDVALARDLIADARRCARRLPESRLLEDRIAEVEAGATTPGEAALSARASLTTAELRILGYLPTHLSFREIAGRLYVSANTVKTQAHAVYRKLDASSRSQAVAHAAELGLLDG